MHAKLYSGTRNASSWALRAWLALREAGVDFEEEVVDIRRPQRFANLRAIAAVSPVAQVPVLVVDGEAIFDSLAIMAFANDACGGALLPAAPIRRAQAWSLVAWQHAGLSNICSRISFESAFYPEKRDLTEQEVAEAQRLVAVLERTLERSAGPFLFGNLSLADLALAPTVVRLTRHDLDLDAHPSARDWTQRLLRLSSLQAWLAEADRLPHVWFDDYLVPNQPIRLHRSAGPPP